MKLSEPAQWDIQPNGVDITARHRITGHTFSGTRDAFNDYLETYQIAGNWNENVLAIGTIVESPTAPTNGTWLPCDGDIYDRAEYPDNTLPVPFVAVSEVIEYADSWLDTGPNLSVFHSGIYYKNKWGDSNQIWESTDGINYVISAKILPFSGWYPQLLKLADETIILINGINGDIWSTTDLVTWVPRTTVPTDKFLCIINNGNMIWAYNRWERGITEVYLSIDKGVTWLTKILPYTINMPILAITDDIYGAMIISGDGANLLYYYGEVFTDAGGVVGGGAINYSETFATVQPISNNWMISVNGGNHLLFDSINWTFSSLKTPDFISDGNLNYFDDLFINIPKNTNLGIPTLELLSLAPSVQHSEIHIESRNTQRIKFTDQQTPMAYSCSIIMNGKLFISSYDLETYNIQYLAEFARDPSKFFVPKLAAIHISNQMWLKVSH